MKGVGDTQGGSFLCSGLCDALILLFNSFKSDSTKDPYLLMFWTFKDKDIMSNEMPFTHMMAGANAIALAQLNDLLCEHSISTREDFEDLMTAIFKYSSFNYRDLAKELGYSQPSVHRWINGQYAPHPSVWPLIVKWVKRDIARQISLNPYVNSDQ